jgi:hypothetical protein
VLEEGTGAKRKRRAERIGRIQREKGEGARCPTTLLTMTQVVETNGYLTTS